MCKFRQVLLAMGVAAAVVVAVLLAVKLMPVEIALLVLLGFGLALQLWDRIRRLPTRCPDATVVA